MCPKQILFISGTAVKEYHNIHSALPTFIQFQNLINSFTKTKYRKAYLGTYYIIYYLGIILGNRYAELIFNFKAIHIRAPQMFTQ